MSTEHIDLTKVIKYTVYFDNGIKSLTQTQIFYSSLQPDGENRWYLKHNNIRIHDFKYLRCMKLGWKYVGMKKSIKQLDPIPLIISICICSMLNIFLIFNLHPNKTFINKPDRMLL